jgi:hypothetical protein
VDEQPFRVAVADGELAGHRGGDGPPALVPGARPDVIAGCGHFPWWGTPGETGRAVRELLA